jgi:hypothetical protein
VNATILQATDDAVTPPACETSYVADLLEPGGVELDTTLSIAEMIERRAAAARPSWDVPDLDTAWSTRRHLENLVTFPWPLPRDARARLEEWQRLRIAVDDSDRGGDVVVDTARQRLVELTVELIEIADISAIEPPWPVRPSKTDLMPEWRALHARSSVYVAEVDCRCSRFDLPVVPLDFAEQRRLHELSYLTGGFFYYMREVRRSLWPAWVRQELKQRLAAKPSTPYPPHHGKGSLEDVPTAGSA